MSLGYRVEYGTVQKHQHSSRRAVWMTALCFALFLVFVNVCWPQGREVLREILWPGEPAAAKQALETFIDELRWGNSFTEAAESFCREIIQYEKTIR